MKNTLFIFSILIITIVSCKTDKKNLLIQLKQERDKLTQQINQLEQELQDSLLTNTPKVGVSVQMLTESLFEHYIEVQGRVDGDDNLAVSTKMPGVVTSVLVKEGQAVKKGQVLAIVDDELIVKGLEEINTQLELATTIFERQKKLWEQQIGSEIQFLSAKTNKEALEKRKASLQEQRAMSKITSPIEGTVEEINIKRGQMASPGYPLFRVVNFSGVKIVADVAEPYSSKIKTGNAVTVYFPDLQQEVQASIDFSARYINPVNRTFMVIARLEKNDLNLRANMISVLKIRDYVNERAFVVPVNLIQSDGKGKYIMTMKNNIAHKVYVETGVSFNGMVELTKGAEKGMQLITSNYQELMGGERIIAQ